MTLLSSENNYHTKKESEVVSQIQITTGAGVITTHTAISPTFLLTVTLHSLFLQ